MFLKKMIASYERSASNVSVLDFKTTHSIKDITTAIQTKVDSNNIPLRSTALKLKSNSTAIWKRSSKDEEMATSFVYSDHETTTHTAIKQDITTLPAQTVATFIINNKRPTIIVYPTVSPESIVIPIVSCILGFPLLALLVICCLRRRAKLARERDRRRNYDMQDHAVSLVRFSPIHRLNNRSSRAISLRPERSLSRGFPSLELDTVLEERSDIEQTQTEIFNSDSPLESTSQRNSCSS